MVIFHQFGKKFKTQSEKVLGANSYVCRNYRERTKRGGLFGREIKFLKSLFDRELY